MSSRKRTRKMSLASPKVAAILSVVLSVGQSALPIQQALAAPPVNSIHDIVGLPGQVVSLDLQQIFGTGQGTYSISPSGGTSNIVTTERNDDTLKLYLNEPGTASFTVTLNGMSDDFSVQILDVGPDGQMDIGDLVKYMNANRDSITSKGFIGNMLTQIAPGKVGTNQRPTVTEATYQLPNNQYLVNYQNGMKIPLPLFFSDADNEPLTYRVTPSYQHGITASVIGTQLQLSGTKNSGTTPAPTSFTVFADDPKGAFAQFSLVLNTPPAASSVTYSVYSAIGQTPAPFDLSTRFQDLDGDALTFSITGSRTVTGSAYGSPLVPIITNKYLEFSGKLQGKAEIDVTASDNKGGSAMLTYIMDPALTSLPNNPPIAIPQAAPYIHTMGNPLPVIQASSLFQDDDAGEVLTYTLNTSASNGILSQLNNGLLTFALSSAGITSFTSSSVFQLTAADKMGAAVSNTYTIKLNRKPEGSSVTTDVYRSATPSAIYLTSRFGDPDGESLTYSVSPGYSNGLTATVVDNHLVFAGKPTADATFYVTAADSNGVVSEAVPFYLVLKNQAPVVKDNAVLKSYFAIGEPYFRSVPLSELFQDPDFDLLAYTVTAVLGNGLTAYESSGNLYVYGTPEGEADAVFRVEAADSQGLQASAEYRLKPNHKPEVQVTAPTGTLYTIGSDISGLSANVNSWFTDSDEDVLTYAVTPASSNGLVAMLKADTGSLSFSLTSAGITNPSLPAEFTFSAADGKGGSNSLSYTIEINRKPHADSLELVKSVTYGGSVPSIDLTADSGDSFHFTDPEGDELTFEVSPSVSGGLTAYITSGSWLLFSGDATGDAMFTVTAMDKRGAAATGTYTVLTSNQAPVADASVQEKSYLIDSASFPAFTLSEAGFSDPDGHELTYTVDDGPVNGVTAGISDGILSFAGSPAAVADMSFTVTATDPGGLIATKMFTLKANHAPTAAIPTSTVYYNVGIGIPSTTVTLSTFFADIDTGDHAALTYALTADTFPSGAAASVSGDELVYSVADTADATVTLIVNASDGKGGEAKLTFLLVPNYAPASSEVPIVNAVYTIDSGTVSNLTRNAADWFTDGDGLSDTMTYTVSPASSNGLIASIDSSTGLLTFEAISGGIPDPESAAEFTVTASDGKGGSYSRSYSVEMNRPPAAASGSLQQSVVLARSSIPSMDVASNFSDPESEPLSFELTTISSGGLNAIISGGMLMFIGDLAITGDAQFQVKAIDKHGASATANYTVTATNLAPTASSEPAEKYYIYDPDGPAASLSDVDFGMDQYFADPDDQTLTYTMDDSTVNGIASSLSTTGLLTFDGVPANVEDTTFEVTATDPGSLSATKAFTLKPNFRTYAVTSSSIVGYYPAGVQSSNTVSLATYFTDTNDQGMLTYALLTGSSVLPTGAAAELPTGSSLLSYTVTPDVTGSIMLNVSATDGKGGGVPTIELWIEPNHGPTISAATTVDHIAGDPLVLDLYHYFSDPDSDTLTFTWSGINAELGSGSLLSITEPVNADREFQVTAADSKGASVEATISIHTRHKPEAVGDGETAAYYTEYSSEYGSRTFSLSTYFADEDGDALTYTVVPDPAALTEHPELYATSPGILSSASIALSSGSYKLSLMGKIPSGSTAVSIPYVVTASDGTGLSVSRTFSIDLNHPPQSTENSYIYYFDGSADLNNRQVELSSYFKDSDSDVLTYMLITSSLNGLSGAVIAGSKLILTGELDRMEGYEEEAEYWDASFTVQAIDGKGGTTTRTIYTEQNEQPEAWNENIYMMFDDWGIQTDSLYEYFGDDDDLTFSIDEANSVIPQGLSAAVNLIYMYENELPVLELSVNGYHSADGDATVRIKASDGKGGVAYTNFIFKWNVAPVSMLGSEYFVSDDTEWIDFIPMFADPYDYLTVDLSFNQEADRVQVLSSPDIEYWLQSISPSEYTDLLSLDYTYVEPNPYPELHGYVNIQGKDGMGERSVTQNVQISHAEGGFTVEPAAKHMAHDSTLILKQLYKRYGALAQSDTVFRVSSSDSYAVSAYISHDGKDLVLESNPYFSGYSTITVFGTNSNSIGFIDQFLIYISPPSNTQGQWLLSNPFNDTTVETVALTQNVVSLDGSVSASARVNDAGALEITTNPSSLSDEKVFTIQSTYNSDGSPATIYKVKIDPNFNGQWG